MKISKKINWNGFLQAITNPSRSRQESCAWIFADIKNNNVNDVWEIFDVKNAGLKANVLRKSGWDNCETLEERLRVSFAPDKKDFARVKRMARKCKLTRIGNVHTHIVIGNDKNEMEYQLKPSEPDLAYARKYNDIIRAVIVVNFPPYTGAVGTIYGIVWFDQHGRILKRQRY